MKQVWPLFVVAVLLCGCHGGTGTRPPMTAQFCNVVGHPSDFEGRSVAFHAQIVSNGMDRSALIDPACPGRIAAFDVTGAREAFEDARKIIMGIGRPGTIDKIVEADFVGVPRQGKVGPTIYLSDVQHVSYRMTGGSTTR